jgi:hypothetical protein
MALYYVGCRIESAVSHLVHQPDENWPNDWEQLLDREFVSSHVVFFLSTRPDSFIAIVACNAADSCHSPDRRNSCTSSRGIIPRFSPGIWNVGAGFRRATLQHVRKYPHFLRIGTQFWRMTFEANGG